MRIASAPCPPLLSGANPTSTVAAVTYRTAEAMRDRHLDAPGELIG